MQIGQLIARSGASAKAIRLYESRGLLGPVPRRGTYRCYDVSHLERLLLIRQAQSVGFSLAELEPLLRGVDTPDWALLRQHLQAKRQAVRAELARLRRLDARLGEVDEEIARCLADTARADDVLCNTSAPLWLDSALRGRPQTAALLKEAVHEHEKGTGGARPSGR